MKMTTEEIAKKYTIIKITHFRLYGDKTKLYACAGGMVVGKKNKFIWTGFREMLSPHLFNWIKAVNKEHNIKSISFDPAMGKGGWVWSIVPTLSSMLPKATVEQAKYRSYKSWLKECS